MVLRTFAYQGVSVRNEHRQGRGGCFVALGGTMDLTRLWIPTDEQKPADGRNVLFVTEGQVEAGYYDSYPPARFVAGAVGVSEEQVSHWMYFPLGPGW